MRICSVDGCSKKHEAKGFCAAHYQRRNRNSEEFLKPIQPRTGIMVNNKRLFWVLHGMKARCYNLKCHGYERYGEKGISVCEEWRSSSTNFIKWALANGYREGLQIDRIDNTRGYSPDNCRWVDAKVQNRNRKSVRLSAEKLPEIQELRRFGWSQQMIAEKYGCKQVAISRILLGQSWSD